MDTAKRNYLYFASTYLQLTSNEYVFLIIQYETETLNQLRYCAVLTVKLYDTQHGVSIFGTKKRKLTSALHVVLPLKLMKTFYHNSYLCNKTYAICVISLPPPPQKKSLVQ
jgi:hypothetical protein